MLGPDPENEIAFRQRLARRGNGDVAIAEPDRLRAGCRLPRNGRKFIGGEPMKSATNSDAGRS